MTAAWNNLRYTTVETPGEPPILEYRFPYDVALWATIADFPYSWPLWQRFAERFVNSHLVGTRMFVFRSSHTSTPDILLLEIPTINLAG